MDSRGLDRFCFLLDEFGSPSLTVPSSSPLPNFHAFAEMDVQRGGIREHEVRKPVVLMFSLWSFDLASGQLPLISVFVDDY